MSDGWFALKVNPDPWAIGPLGVGRNPGTKKLYPYVGRNTQLFSYQEAVKELLGNVEMMPPGQYKLTFFFWRRLDSHDSGRKHYADATNLVKATEDALQGVLIENDRFVREVRGVIAEQEVDTEPMVVLHIEMWEDFDITEIPGFVWRTMADATMLPTESDNSWPPS